MPNSLRRLFNKLRFFARREKFDNDLAEEMAYHRELKQRDLEASNPALTARDARHATNREFGNDLYHRDQSRDVIGFWFETTLQDFRFSLRQLRKNLGFTVTAILMLALGMAASVAIFSFVDAALLKPLPYRDPSRLVGVFESITLFKQSDLSIPDYLDWKKRNEVFTSLEIYTRQGLTLLTKNGVERVSSGRVSDGFFRVLGVTPILGRDFAPGDDLVSAPRTTLLSYSAWLKRYGGSPDILGQSVTLDGKPHTIIGVLPRDFHFVPAEPAEFWTALHPEGQCDLSRGCHSFYGVARLKDGVTLQQSLANVTSIAQQLEREYPDTNRDQGANITPLYEYIVGDLRPILFVLLGGAALLLIIAGVNIASLLLVRAESRRREIAVRGALGASPVRLIRQFVTEGVVVVLTGTVFGLGLAYGGMRLLSALIPAEFMARMAFWQNLSFSPRVLMFAGLIAFLAAILFSLTPSVRSAAPNMREDLAEGSRGSAGNAWRRLGSKLIVLELATAVVLLVIAGLLGKSLFRLLNVDTGMNPEHIATLTISAPGATYAKEPQWIALNRLIRERVSAIPGVTNVGTTSLLPVDGWGNTTWFRVLGRPWHGEHNETTQRDITAGYFNVLGAKLLRGRNFDESEDHSKPAVAIINSSFARVHFPGEDPLAHQLSHLGKTPDPIQIIGIVEDIKEGQLDSQNLPVLYNPFNQNADTEFMLAVRTSQDENAILPTLTATIHDIDPQIVAYRGATMTTLINNSMSAYIHRSSAWLVGGFAALALILSVVGLYGVVAYSVSQRTREIGVRMALGAQQSSVYRLILSEAGRLTSIGILLGIACAIGAAAAMQAVLFGVRSWDIPTLFAVAAILTAAALLASFVPAHRAATVDPVVALRTE